MNAVPQPPSSSATSLDRRIRMLRTAMGPLIAAALEDPRFPPVTERELSRIEIEVSFLTQPQELQYSTPEDLLEKLRPNVDGVILRHGFRKATFLPQVWEKVTDPSDFLDQLCYKMGVSANTWRETKLQVYTYQVEEFHELN